MGNLAQFRSKHGIEDDWEGTFGERHSSHYRLTDKGREQAKQAGEHVRNNIFPSFDRCFTSEYVRAMETASLLGLENSDWFVEFNLRERDNGVLAGLRVIVVCHGNIMEGFRIILEKLTQHSWIRLRD